MKKLMHVVLPLILLVFITNAYSRTITVGHDADYDYQTITAALSAAVSGDVILVADGTYSAETGESICFPMKDGVTLKRATTDIRPTLLGHTDQPVIYSEATGAKVEGFKITGGDYYSGAGIYIHSGHLEVIDCIITGNNAQDHGGGVRCSELSQSTFVNCTITENSAAMGGGVACWGKATFTNCSIAGNSARENGGGIRMAQEASAAFFTCEISGNSSEGAGGGLSLQGSAQLVDCVIKNNHAKNLGGGISGQGKCSFLGCQILNNSASNHTWYFGSISSGGGAYFYGNSQLLFKNCIISGNSASASMWRPLEPPFPVPPFPGSMPSTAQMDSPATEYTFKPSNAVSSSPGPYGLDSIGGGLFISGGAYAAIHSCIIYNNSCTYSWYTPEDSGSGFGGPGGIYYYSTDNRIDITNSVIVSNLYGAGAITLTGLDPVVENSIIGRNLPDNGNAIINYSNISGGYLGRGTGNIDTDSLFIDPENGDFRLRDDSPCIDAGNPDLQWNDACLPPGQGTQRNDMGAYGGPYNCGWGEPTAPPVRFDFNNGPQGWSFAGRIGSFNEPNNTWDTEGLGLSPAGLVNCFSYCGSPVIYVQQDKSYRVRWTVSSSVSNADEALDFRLRANQLGNWRVWTTSVTSLNDAAPTTQTKTYDLIILPEMESPTDSIFLSFDLVGFDPANDLRSWLYLDEVRMDAVSITPILPTVLHAYYTFDNDSEGWEFQGKIADFDEPLPVVEPGRIGLSPNSSPYCFSYWLSPEIQVRKDGVYKVRWQVSSSTSNPEQVVDFRLRCNQTSNLRAWDTGTLFSLGAAYPAGGEPRTYELMILPQMSAPSDTIQLSFDILSFDGSNDLDSSIYLEDVTVQEYLIQP